MLDLEAKAAAANAAPVASAEEVEARMLAGLEAEDDADESGLTGAQDGTDTGEGEEDDDEETEAAKAEAVEKAAQDAQKLQEFWKGVPAEIQAKLEKRFGKLTAKNTAAETRAAELEAELAEAKAAENRPSEAILDIAPEYLNKEEAEQIKAYQSLQDAEAWLLDNFEGHVGTGTADEPEYTSAKIRTRYRQVKTELDALGTKPRELISSRRKIMSEDLKVGRALRLERERLAKGGKTKTTTKPPAGTMAQPKKQVARLSLTQSSGKGFDTKTLMEQGPTKEGIMSAYENAFK